jgi:hypothetical protein
LNRKDNRFDNTPTPTTAVRKRADGIASISRLDVQAVLFAVATSREGHHLPRSGRAWGAFEHCWRLRRINPMAVDQLVGLFRRLANFSDKIMKPNKYLERHRDSMRAISL